MFEKNVAPIISVGIPIYNGEKFLKEGGIDDVLLQSIKDIEIIIGDNASSDNTSKICKEYAEKDNRIKYFRHEVNIGGLKNFQFLLKKAKGKFFMWKAIDDLIDPKFIEKCLPILQDKNVACSVAQVEYFGPKTDFLKSNKNKSKIMKFKKKVIKRFSPLSNISAQGNFEENIRKFLKIRGHHHVFYGIYRTHEIKKQFVVDIMQSYDFATILNVLKIGKFCVTNEVLMKRYDEGESAVGFFKFKKSQGLSYFGAIFLYLPFTKWFIKNFGKKVFLKNFDLLIIWNLEGFFYFGVGILRKISKIFSS